MLTPIKAGIPHLGQKTRAKSVLIFQRPQYSFSLGRILSLVVDCGLISEKVASWNVVFSVVELQFTTSCSRITVDLLIYINGLPIFIQKNHSQPQKSNSIQEKPLGNNILLHRSCVAPLLFKHLVGLNLMSR